MGSLLKLRARLTVGRSLRRSAGLLTMLILRSWTSQKVIQMSSLRLGIILARRKPAIIVRNTSMAAAKGVAVPADIVGIERIEYANATEDLRAKIGSVCQRIVGLKNA